MASLAQTLVRFVGAVALGTAATAIDNPKLFVDQTREVVVLTRDVGAGERLAPGDVELARRPVAMIPSSALTGVDAALRYVAVVPLYKGEAVTLRRLAPPPLDNGIIKITPGKRAFGIRVDDPSQLALAGTIEPNSRVDVLAVVPDAASGRTRALLVIQNLRVLAIHAITGAERGAQPGRSAVATLEVTSSEGELLARAQAQAPLRLTLRAYGDPAPSAVSVDRR